jgi:5'-nucleotidase
VIDLHLHSDVSDGIAAPADVVKRAASVGLTTIAIADQLNVNIPACKEHELEGVSYTRQGKSYWDDMFERRLDPQERPYYWLKGHYILEDKDEDIDDIVIRENKISITPIHYDLTNYQFLEQMRENWKSKF